MNTLQMILIAGSYRSGTDQDVAIARRRRLPVYRVVEEIPGYQGADA